MPDGLYFRQLLAGRDFAVDDGLATTMRNHTYVIGDAHAGEVLLVDPAYDVAGLLGWVRDRDLNVTGAVATHYHADHVGGEILGERIEGLSELLELADVPVHLQRDELPWVAEMTGAPVSSLVAHGDDDVVQVGSVLVRLLHTPGHTQGSQCLVVGDNLVAGDTLFIQGCGRTDLPGADAEDMYTSLRRLASLPGHLTLWPGHHYSTESSAALQDVLSTNPVLERVDRAQWLRQFT
ncbi:MAG: MBL fold metallo-hydrolase [Acidimicrobiales bacterium]|jgi:glyoxylase-like metal-dependent hydrolase (beta-lactamase superfamily II)